MLDILENILSTLWIIFLFAVTLYLIWALTPWGQKVLHKLPPTDDPSGNNNITRKPWDYM